MPAALIGISRAETIRRCFLTTIVEDETTHIGRFGLLAGDDLTLIQPPFTLRAKEDSSTIGGGCFGSPFPPGLQSREVEVVNLPFDYAVPVLSGWSLSYPCDDEHVLDMGVWLDNLAYEKGPDEATGVLRYRVNSILRDDDNDPAHFSRHKVDILGINGREPTDLIAERDGSGGCFGVRVINDGDDDAPASVTRYRIGGADIDVETPAIAKGFSFLIDDLEVPQGLCSGDCGFEVTVDAEMDVQETIETNNELDGICVG